MRPTPQLRHSSSADCLRRQDVDLARIGWRRFDVVTTTSFVSAVRAMRSRGFMTQVRVTVDGVEYADDVEPRMLLVQYLRERLGKTGTVIGCDTSNCGACTVHLNGQSVKSCSVLAVQADGAEITTIEGLASDGKLHPVQQAFNDCHALQCGYCTPGMIMQAVDLLKENPEPSEEEVRHGLEGNLCRCTGYQNIVRAVQEAAQKMKTPAAAGGGS